MILNEHQRKAAEFMKGIASVIAVPGSGKTLTMTHRISNLVKNGVAPENILGLTFTKNAAQSMKDRLRAVLNNNSDRVTLSTIHSFCHSILKKEGKKYELLYGKEQLIFIKNIMKVLKIKDLSTGLVLREISLAKNNMIFEDEFKDLYTNDTAMEKIAVIYHNYESEKNSNMLMDFDDLLVETYKLLSNNQDILNKYKNIFQHLLVDEFQDTNPIQMEILKLLLDNNGSLWVCGDDWQSIYAFTGASIGNILGFKTIFPQSQEFILNINYRSTAHILKACQNLINYNIKKIDKTLNTDNQCGDEVVILECSTEDDEGIQIVNEISDIINRNDYKYKDVAVLYRANFQSRVIEEVFSQHKIPYHIENGQKFYDRREVKLLLDYLRIINNPYSDTANEALLNIINVPNRYISKKFCNELKEFSSERDINLYKGLKIMPVNIPYLKNNINELIGFLNPLIKNSKSFKPAELITVIRETLDYDRYITDDDIPSPDDTKIENINQLILASAKYSDIESFIKYTETFKDESANDMEGVSLMTVHKSKGLEFPVVFVIGLVEGILPSKKTGNIEEERRVAFVAISRAMKLLYLSYFHTYCGNEFKRSRFIDEISG